MIIGQKRGRFNGVRGEVLAGIEDLEEIHLFLGRLILFFLAFGHPFTLQQMFFYICQKGGRLSIRIFTKYSSPGTPGKIQVLPCPRHGNVEQPSLFFRVGRFQSFPVKREIPVFTTGDKDDRKFQPLGGMYCYQWHFFSFGAVNVSIRIESDSCEKRFGIITISIGEFAQIIARLGFLAVR